MTRTLMTIASLSLLVGACGGGDEGSGSSDNGTGASDSGSGASGSSESGSGGDDTSGTTGPSGSGAGGGSTGTASGPASSSAGSGGSPPMGACTNDADMQIVMSQDVEALVEQCASDNFGAEPGTKDCIKSSTGLSDPCVACFDQTVQCSVMNCIGDCLGGQSPECDACVEANCMPAFQACSGLTGG